MGDAAEAWYISRVRELEEVERLRDAEIAGLREAHGSALLKLSSCLDVLRRVDGYMSTTDLWEHGVLTNRHGEAGERTPAMIVREITEAK
jgi:hypothetical protein